MFSRRILLIGGLKSLAVLAFGSLLGHVARAGDFDGYGYCCNPYEEDCGYGYGSGACDPYAYNCSPYNDSYGYGGYFGQTFTPSANIFAKSNDLKIFEKTGKLV